MDIANLRELLEKAAARPWRIGEENEARADIWSWPETGHVLAAVAEGSILNRRSPHTNAALIVAAVNALPALLDEVELYVDEIKQLKRRLQEAIRSQSFRHENDCASNTPGKTSDAWCDCWQGRARIALTPSEPK